MSSTHSVRIVGAGRAGTSLADALTAVGWNVDVVASRGPVSAAAEGVDLCVIATSDAAIADVARAIGPVGTTVVAHLSGSLGLDVLEPHPRRASIHPLVSLPDRLTGAAALQHNAWFAVDGDPIVTTVAAALGGRTIEPSDKAMYHAAACVAGNHVVALMAQVERLARRGGVDAEPFYDLAAGALANARAHGAAAALTGPAVRGDWATIDRHLEAIGPDERDLYLTVSKACT